MHPQPVCAAGPGQKSVTEHTPLHGEHAVQRMVRIVWEIPPLCHCESSSEPAIVVSPPHQCVQSCQAPLLVVVEDDTSHHDLVQHQ